MQTKTIKYSAKEALYNIKKLQHKFTYANMVQKIENNRNIRHIDIEIGQVITYILTSY